jgi:hypothetical protein
MRRCTIPLLALLAVYLGGLAWLDAQEPIKTGLVVPARVQGTAGAAIHVKGTSAAKVFLWLAGSDGLEVYTAAPGSPQGACAVRALTPGTYRLWCVAVLGNLTATKQIEVVVTGAPAPPDPPPDPPPPPTPAPAVGKLFLVVVETPAGAATRGQLFADPALTALMRIKGHRWRIVDAAVVSADGKPPADVAPYLELARGQMLPQLFIVNEDGRRLFSGALPATADAIADLIKKVGG